MAFSDLLKNPLVKILLAFVAGVLITASIVISINPKDPPEGVLTCENSDVGIPVGSGNGGTLLDWDNISNGGVLLDLEGTNPAFGDSSPECYDVSNNRFVIDDDNHNRSDGFQMGRTLRVISRSGTIHAYDFDAQTVGLRRVGNTICVYQL